MKQAFAIAASLATLVVAGAARADQYVDYTPDKSMWEINAIEVDPNHIDDYLVGLKKTQVPGFEVLKKHGYIDAWKFVIRNGYNKGSPNVLIMTHIIDIKFLQPDKARDMALDKEMLALMPKEEGKAAVAGYEKYRQFVDDGYWTEITYPK